MRYAYDNWRSVSLIGGSGLLSVMTGRNPSAGAGSAPIKVI